MSEPLPGAAGFQLCYWQFLNASSKSFFYQAAIETSRCYSDLTFDNDKIELLVLKKKILLGVKAGYYGPNILSPSTEKPTGKSAHISLCFTANNF